ncbi:MAG: restriction endonuclease subunit S [Planctomycetes bacterium]|nr:restriction endonuclease subunit S [Planctomycetota bacterium]
MNNVSSDCALDLSLIRTVPQDLRREKYLLQPGDVLCCTTNSGALVGKVCFFDQHGDWAFSNHLTRVRPRREVIDPRWLYYALRRLWQMGAYEELTRNWVNQSTLPKDDLAQCDVPLPPLAEQKRIVAKLEALLARVNAARDRIARVPAILKRFRRSVLAAACSGRLTEDWRGERGLEDSWPLIQLGDGAQDFSYGSASKSSKSGNVPVIRMGNIQDGSLDWSDLVYTSDRHEITKYRLAAGDVLFNRTNSPELVGKTAVYGGERDAIYAGYLIRVRCADRLLPDYLSYCLNSPAGRDYCQQVKTDGVSQSNINARKLAAFEFGLPTVAEQHEIVRRVEALFKLADAIEARVAAATARADRLTQSILAKAFRGELVPTEAEIARREDRDYEPASVLLERISATSRHTIMRAGRGRGRGREK